MAVSAAVSTYSNIHDTRYIFIYSVLYMDMEILGVIQCEALVRTVWTVRREERRGEEWSMECGVVWSGVGWSGVQRSAAVRVGWSQDKESFVEALVRMESFVGLLSKIEARMTFSSGFAPAASAKMQSMFSKPCG